ncbi:uncharacterized protein LOC100903053 [Galendromus occidentalis]|uniref:Uncharacterized protein LOC100903053 n=1 Tax=Galendromus occidentalis TaxID=34638 RepID=A0AAJ7PAJ0_9ACAR|nr:uncharacterized protein LOC100903053 [Galendromus occidentalis]
MSSTDESQCENGVNDSKGDSASKRIKIESHTRCSPRKEGRSVESTMQLTVRSVENREATPDDDTVVEPKTDARVQVKVVDDTEGTTRAPAERAPPQQSPGRISRSSEGYLYKTVSPPSEEGDSSLDLVLHESEIGTYFDKPTPNWQSDFFRKCAELVELRFSKPIRTTCVKPFYGNFSSCWRDCNEALRLETSSLPAHREFQATISDCENCQEVFSPAETAILIRNFFQIAKAYSLRHPYLLACLQTGLETRKEVYDFNKFRTAHQLVEKLCLDLPEKSSLGCIVQLRSILTPQVLPYTGLEAENVVAELFARFGPDWNTISRLTGFNQFTLKTMVAIVHNVDLGVVSPQVWFEIHQKVLYVGEFGVSTDITKCRNFEGGLERKRLRLPAFNTLYSPLRP